MKSIVLATLILSSSVLLAQEQAVTRPAKPKAKAPAAVLKDPRPVTVAEARTVSLRLRSKLGAGIGYPIPGSTKLGTSSKPATREQLVEDFASIFQAAYSQFKFTPNPVAFDAAVLKIGASERPSLEKLIRFGCVARVGPLATGPEDSLTVAEYGDAVGFFIGRIAQLSHLPSSRWTPALGAGRG